MGELQHEAFRFAFNGFLKVAFQGSRVTSDAGLLLVRELDERLGLEALISEHLSDSRQGLNTQFSLADFLRQSVYSRPAGYEDLKDAVSVSSAPPAWRTRRPRGTPPDCPPPADGREPGGARAGRDADARRPDRARHGFERESGAVVRRDGRVASPWCVVLLSGQQLGAEARRGPA